MNKLGLIMLQHGHMAIGTDIWPSLQTFGRNFDQNFVYNTEMKIYGHMSVKLVFITQATGKSNTTLKER